MVRIGPKNYHYDTLVKVSKTEETIQRHHIKTTECALPFFTGVSFSTIRWEGGEIVGLTSEGREAFRVRMGLPA